MWKFLRNLFSRKKTSATILNTKTPLLEEKHGGVCIIQPQQGSPIKQASPEDIAQNNLFSGRAKRGLFLNYDVLKLICEYLPRGYPRDPELANDPLRETPTRKSNALEAGTAQYSEKIALLIFRRISRQADQVFRSLNPEIKASVIEHLFYDAKANESAKMAILSAMATIKSHFSDYPDNLILYDKTQYVVLPQPPTGENSVTLIAWFAQAMFPESGYEPERSAYFADLYKEFKTAFANHQRLPINVDRATTNPRNIADEDDNGSYLYQRDVYNRFSYNLKRCLLGSALLTLISGGGILLLFHLLEDGALSVETKPERGHAIGGAYNSCDELRRMPRHAQWPTGLNITTVAELLMTYCTSQHEAICKGIFAHDAACFAFSPCCDGDNERIGWFCAMSGITTRAISILGAKTVTLVSVFTLLILMPLALVNILAFCISIGVFATLVKPVQNIPYNVLPSNHNTLIGNLVGFFSTSKRNTSIRAETRTHVAALYADDDAVREHTR